MRFFSPSSARNAIIRTAGRQKTHVTYFPSLCSAYGMPCSYFNLSPIVKSPKLPPFCQLFFRTWTAVRRNEAVGGKRGISDSFLKFLTHHASMFLISVSGRRIWPNSSQWIKQQSSLFSPLWKQTLLLLKKNCCKIGGKAINSDCRDIGRKYSLSCKREGVHTPGHIEVTTIKSTWWLWGHPDLFIFLLVFLCGSIPRWLGEVGVGGGERLMLFSWQQQKDPSLLSSCKMFLQLPRQVGFSS